MWSYLKYYHLTSVLKNKYKQKNTTTTQCHGGGERKHYPETCKESEIRVRYVIICFFPVLEKWKAGPILLTIWWRRDIFLKLKHTISHNIVRVLLVSSRNWSYIPSMSPLETLSIPAIIPLPSRLSKKTEFGHAPGHYVKLLLFVLHVVMYMFHVLLLKSSHSSPSPLCPKFCSLCHFWHCWGHVLHHYKIYSRSLSFLPECVVYRC